MRYRETEKMENIMKFTETGRIIIPSLCDAHVHLREPGFFYKESIETGSLAALQSGYGFVFSMPNLNPVPDSLENLKIQLDIIKASAFMNVIPYGAITVGEKGEKLANLEEIAPYVIAFSDDGNGLNDQGLMREAMLRAKALGRPIVAHCEDLRLRNGGYIHQGEYARINRHQGISSESEWKPIERDIKLAEETGCAFHICHVSARESVELVRDAKKSGIDVSCETAPHYLTLTDADLKEDGRFKMNPPIRSAKDRAALIEGVQDGTIEIIATDHAPHSAEEKSRGLKDSLMGVVGLETAFPVVYTKLVKTGIISLDKMVELMCENPRRRFNLPDCNIETDYAEWDVDTEYVISPDEFKSKGHSTPFDGWKVFGRCMKTVINGETRFDREASSGQI